MLLAPGHGVGLVEDGDAQALGRGALVRMPRRDRHLGGAVTGDEGGAEPDRPGPEDQDPIIRSHVGQAHPVHRDGQRLGERGGDRVDPVGDRGQVDQRSIDELSEPAVPSEADARAALAAQVGAPALAERARPSARDVGGDGVADIRQAGRPVHDDAGQLVAGRRAQRLADLTVEEVEVAAADPAGLDLQPHPPRLERPRLLLDDLDAFVRPDGSAHAVDRTHREVRPRADAGGRQRAARERLPLAISVPSASRRCSQKRRKGSSQASTSWSGWASRA